MGRVRRTRQRLGPNGSIESDPAIEPRARRVRSCAGSLPIESYRLSRRIMATGNCRASTAARHVAPVRRPYNLTWAAAWTDVRDLVGSMQCGCFHPPTSSTSLRSTLLPAAFRSGRSEPSRFGSATRSSPAGVQLALGLTCLGAWLVSRHSKFRFIEISLAIAVLGNVAMHVVASVLTWTYSPGLVSGVLMWVPLGTVRLRSARRTSTPRGYMAGVYLGLSVVLITMAVVAVGGFTSL